MVRAKYMSSAKLDQPPTINLGPLIHAAAFYTGTVLMPPIRSVTFSAAVVYISGNVEAVIKATVAAVARVDIR
jgi:hypothetical protein